MNVQTSARVFSKEDVRTQIREAVAGGNLRRIAREAKVAPNTIYGFINPDAPSDPQGDTIGKLARWLEGRTEPEDYWRGVSYAAQAMSETLARLLAEMNTSARSKGHPDAPAVKQAAKAAPVQSRSKAGSPRQGRDPGASSTAPLPAGSDCE
jgi:hypothetical protein